MRLTERQARLRLAAVAAAGGQAAFTRTLGLPDARAQCLVSRSLLGRNRVSPPILAALGLRRDAGGDVHRWVGPAVARLLTELADGLEAEAAAARAVAARVSGG